MNLVNGGPENNTEQSNSLKPNPPAASQTVNASGRRFSRIVDGITGFYNKQKIAAQDPANRYKMIHSVCLVILAVCTGRLIYTSIVPPAFDASLCGGKSCLAAFNGGANEYLQYAPGETIDKTRLFDNEKINMFFTSQEGCASSFLNYYSFNRNYTKRYEDVKDEPFVRDCMAYEKSLMPKKEVIETFLNQWMDNPESSNYIYVSEDNYCMLAEKEECDAMRQKLTPVLKQSRQLERSRQIEAGTYVMDHAEACSLLKQHKISGAESCKADLKKGLSIHEVLEATASKTPQVVMSMTPLVMRSKS